jgi:hypothetical protein
VGEKVSGEGVYLEKRWNDAWQRATTRNGALWKKDGNLSVFGPPPPTSRQVENWHAVVMQWCFSLEKRGSGARPCVVARSGGIVA